MAIMPVYEMPLYRPPSEGDNLIIQATLGCSFNGCTFCSMYKEKTFRARPLDEVFADIEAAARDWPEAHRVFLADGDALVLSMPSLRLILERLDSTFLNLARVSAYATPTNLLRKSPAELAELKERKLSLVYVGIETGSADILRRIRKGATVKSMVAALERATAAGLKISATVVLGLGGRQLWREHIDGTVDLVNRAPPNYLSTLELGLEKAVAGDFMAKYGAAFQFQDDDGILAEQQRLIAGLEPPRPIIFRSNHASNCLALAGNLPRDRGRLSAEIAAARAGERRLRPKAFRSL